MGIQGSMSGPGGDMKKATYDSNNNGIIEVAETEADMVKTAYDPDDDGVFAIAQTEADMKKSVYDSDDDGVFHYNQLSDQVMLKMNYDPDEDDVIASAQIDTGLMRKSDYDPNTDGVIAVAQTEADMKKSVYDSNDDGVFDEAQIDTELMRKSDYDADDNGVCDVNFEKYETDVLRTSHDAETQNDGQTWVKVKTITFTGKIHGTLRMKFDMRSENGACTSYGRIYKNGTPLGVENTHNTTSYVTKSQDIDIGYMVSGNTLELWIKSSCSTLATIVRYFRLYYSNVIPLVVGSTNS